MIRKMVLVLLLLAISAAGWAASFDCGKASTKIEKMICADAKLSSLDEKLASEYQNTLNAATDRDSVKRQQREWLTKIRNKCSNNECLEAAYSERLRQLGYQNKDERGIAGIPDKATEEKKTAIERIMRQGQFKAYIQHDEKFCAVFLDDFTKQRGIEHIKPIVEVDDYNDPKLQDYLQRCPSRDFLRHPRMSSAHTIHAIKDKEQVLGRPLTDEEEAEYDQFDLHMTRNFKLYKANIDNDANNGDEYIFYAEGAKDVASSYTYGSYSIIDWNNCSKGMGVVATRDPFDYKKKQPLENYNGIIKYKDEHYIFDLYGDPWPRYQMRLEEYQPKKRTMSGICYYTTADSK